MYDRADVHSYRNMEHIILSYTITSVSLIGPHQAEAKKLKRKKKKLTNSKLTTRPLPSGRRTLPNTSSTHSSCPLLEIV